MLQPFLHNPDLPQMRITNELRLSRNILDPVAIPVVASASDQELRMQIGISGIERVPRRSLVTMVADLVPHVLITINVRQPWRRDEVSAVVVVAP